MQKGKLYCYVDETGQDTKGKLFIVSVVVVEGNNKDQIEKQLKKIERKTGKNRSKWIRSKREVNENYMRTVLRSRLEIGFYYSLFFSSKDYVALTILAIAKVFHKRGQDERKLVILIDVLPKSRRLFVGSQLRRLGVHTQKVRGIREEETSAFLRLADALSGFVRAVQEGDSTFNALYKRYEGRILFKVY